MEDNSWRFVNLAKNALSCSAPAKRAAVMNPPGEAKSGCEKSPGWIGELVHGLALSSQACALISEPFSDHRVDPFWIGLSRHFQKYMGHGRQQTTIACHRYWAWVALESEWKTTRGSWWT